MLETRIQVIIQEQTKHGQFNDALYFSPEEYAALSEEQINSKIQERVNNWVNFLDNQISNPAPAPTEEDLLAQRAALEEQIDIINSQLSE